MRPYLAIIRDSFAEAFASRVLWFLLAIITLVLVALAPIGIQEERTLEFQRADVRDARGLIKAIHKQHRAGRPSAGRRIWEKFDASTRQQLDTFSQSEDVRGKAYFQDVDYLVTALNGLLNQDDLYRPEDWNDVILSSEARELLKRDGAQLPRDDLARANRVLIETPFSSFLRPRPPRHIVLTYMGFVISPPLQISATKAKQLIETLIIPMIISVLVGMLAVFVAILVTAPIIPQMFDPGSLSLLLSKPISRSLLFLAKFIGGCAFIVINITYLIGGFWLIAGARFGIWNQRLLLCIPIFLFLFAIYYSVSALAGVLWRNAIVSIVLTVVFWLACTVVGGTKGIFERLVIDSHRIIRIVPADDSLIALSEHAATTRWDATTRSWEPTFMEQTSGPHVRVLGPIYGPEQKALYAARNWRRKFFGSGGALLVGKQDDGFSQQTGPTLPAGTFQLMADPDGHLLAATPAGIERFVPTDAASTKEIEVLWMKITTSFGKPFRDIGPTPDLTLTPPMAAAIDHKTGDVVIYSHGNLIHLPRKGNRYQRGETIEIPGDPELGASVAMGGSTVLVALSDGRLLNYAIPTWKLRRSDLPEPRSQPRFIEASPDGRWFGIVFQNGMFHILNAGQHPDSAPGLADVQGQGTISAVAFPSSKRMLVADRVTRITEYEPGSHKILHVHAPKRTALEVAYEYAILPIYTIFPKPGELSNTVLYVVKGDETTDLGLQSGDLQAERQKLHPWTPVWSSLAFMLVMLGLACLYVERQDF